MRLRHSFLWRLKMSFRSELLRKFVRCAAGIVVFLRLASQGEENICRAAVNLRLIKLRRGP